MDSVDEAGGEKTLQGEGGIGPWMNRVRVKNSGGRALFSPGRGRNWLPLSVEFGGRCFWCGHRKWLSSFAVFLKQRNSPCFSCFFSLFHPAREVQFESRHCWHMVWQSFSSQEVRVWRESRVYVQGVPWWWRGTDYLLWFIDMHVGPRTSACIWVS